MKIQARHRLASNEVLSQQMEHKQDALLEPMSPQLMFHEVVLAIERLIANVTHMGSR